MAVTVGEIVEAQVERIMPYGAFVSLPEGKRGLIHISEIADKFVKNVGDFVKEREKVKVKVLSISPDGRKIDLSLKQTVEGARPASHGRASSVSRGPVVSDSGEGAEELYRQIKGMKTKGVEPIQNEFEEKLSKFLKASDERIGDVKRNLEAKRGKGRY